MPEKELNRWIYVHLDKDNEREREWEEMEERKKTSKYDKYL